MQRSTLLLKGRRRRGAQEDVMIFHALEIQSNWGFWLALEGVWLGTGERIRVQWKDGHEEEGIVRVVSHTHGSPGHESEDCTYYFTIDYHGTPVEVLLNDQVKAARLTLSTYKSVPIQTPVQTTENNPYKYGDRFMSAGEQRRWGAFGTIIGQTTHSGLIYNVQFEDGSTAFYYPSELKPISS